MNIYLSLSHISFSNSVLSNVTVVVYLFNVYVGYSIHGHYGPVNPIGRLGGTFTYPPPLRGWARFLFHVYSASPDMSLYQGLGAIFIPCLLREPGYESLRVGPQEPAQRPQGPEPSAEGGEETPPQETTELASGAVQSLRYSRIDFPLLYGLERLPHAQGF